MKKSSIPLKNSKYSLLPLALPRDRGEGEGAVFGPKIVTMRNIEPRVHRQRLIIEGRYAVDVDRNTVRRYLLTLAKKLGMTLHLPEPVITSATGKSKPLHDGYEGVVFWVESGAVIYAWERLKFLTVDIYTCKPFEQTKAVNFTSNFFKFTEMEYQETRLE